MRLDEATVRHQIENLAITFPELADDGEDWSLALSSETELDEMLVKLIRMIDDAKALITGTEARLEELSARKDRFKRRVEAYRALILKLMTAADVRKRELAEATLSIRAGQQRVVVLDEAALPDLACKFIRKPDLTKIKELLQAATCSGAMLSNGDETLTVRVK
jgi:hypothetical protein